MTEAWQKATLSKVCTFENGDRGSNYPSKKVLVSSGIPFVNAGNLSNGRIDEESLLYVTPERFELLSRGKFSEGDVLFCLRGSLGKFALVEGIQQGAIASSLVIVRPNAELDTRYFIHYLSSDFCKRMIAEFEGGAAQPNLSAKDLGKFRIPIPPKAEQKRIVAILDEAFGAIDRAKEIAQQNLVNARELFESYLNRVFTEKGEGWEEKTLDEIFAIGSSKRILESEWTPSGVPFYGGKEIVELAKFGSTVSNAYISEEIYQDYSLKYDMPQAGDILMTARGTIGVGYIVQNSDKFYYKDGNIISYRAKSPTNPQFVLYAFRSNAILEQLTNLQGTTVKHLPLAKAKQLLLKTPTIAVQNDIAKQLKTVEDNSQLLVELSTARLTALDELKQSILQKAFTGQLTAKSPELEAVP